MPQAEKSSAYYVSCNEKQSTPNHLEPQCRSENQSVQFEEKGLSLLLSSVQHHLCYQIIHTLLHNLSVPGTAHDAFSIGFSTKRAKISLDPMDTDVQKSGVREKGM